jgi:signal transduction histidine kinase
VIGLRRALVALAAAGAAFGVVLALVLASSRHVSLRGLEAALALVFGWGFISSLEVADDGAGGADDSVGTGLRGLADRVAALDGRLRVVSPAEAGTIVTAELPCGP